MDPPAANADTNGGGTPPYGVEIALLRDGATSRILVSGEIDIATAPQLQTALAPAHHAHAKERSSSTSNASRSWTPAA